MFHETAAIRAIISNLLANNQCNKSTSLLGGSQVLPTTILHNGRALEYTTSKLYINSTKLHVGIHGYPSSSRRRLHSKDYSRHLDTTATHKRLALWCSLALQLIPISKTAADPLPPAQPPTPAWDHGVPSGRCMHGAGAGLSMQWQGSMHSDQLEMGKQLDTGQLFATSIKAIEP